MAETELKTVDFEKEVVGSELPVLVDFWATWCGPCRMLAPVVAQIAANYEGRLKVCKVNVDEEPELARRFMIMSIPTLIIFKNGEAVDKALGFRPRAELEGWIDARI